MLNIDNFLYWVQLILGIPLYTESCENISKFQTNIL